MSESDPLNPGDTLLIKLGSALVHADEAMSENGVSLDETIFRSLLTDQELQSWLGAMHRLALLPVKRNA